MRLIFNINDEIKKLIAEEKIKTGSSYSEIARRAIVFYLKNRKD